MRISIASYAFHGLVREGKMDVFGYLESCKYRYGLQSADIWNGMLPTTDEDYLRKVKDALDERELTLANLCVDQAHIWENDPDARERNYQNALAHLRAAEILGARTIRIDAGSRDPDFTTEQFDWIVRRYQEYAQRAYDNGYMVGPENHWGPERIPANMQRLIEAVDSPAFGLLLHFGNWESDDPDQADAQAAAWAMHTHISWDITAGPLVEKMQLLRDANYQGYWGVEYHTGQNEYSQVAIQVAQVRDVLQTWRTGSPA
ncbi:MAG: TIM barrel protein [Chloroflexi bacterium]|jgi:sugar phosphate isomerase/epimerase|nr:TIM barrel protein [Chloroflexota bacterium]